MNKFKTELKRGTLELLTLSILEEKMYGYQIIECLNQFGVDVDSNTLYPLLRRLERNGSLESMTETVNGRIRKYYRRTLIGEELCSCMKAIYIENNNIVLKVIGGKNG